MKIRSQEEFENDTYLKDLTILLDTALSNDLIRFIGVLYEDDKICHKCNILLKSIIIQDGSFIINKGEADEGEAMVNLHQRCLLSILYILYCGFGKNASVFKDLKEILEQGDMEDHR